MYLASLGPSRALFRLLLADGLKLLPPPAGHNVEPERIESYLPLGEIATRLTVSYATARADLARLVNLRWVSRARSPRLLGHRHGTVLHLLADVAAQDQTGEVRLVSRLVVADLACGPAAAGVNCRSGVPGPDERGARREWKE